MKMNNGLPLCNFQISLGFGFKISRFNSFLNSSYKFHLQIFLNGELVARKSEGIHQSTKKWFDLYSTLDFFNLLKGTSINDVQF